MQASLKKSQFNFKSSYLAVVAALAIVPVSSYAETAAESSAKSQSNSVVVAEAEQAKSGSVEALPEVSVKQKRHTSSPHNVVQTGSKTDTPLRDIPASISVVTEDLLKEQGAQTMNDAMSNVSSVQPQMGGGYGFANSYNSRGLSLSFLRDNMPDGTAQNNYFRTMYDVERIEVLKGPGSALFGVVGPGGSINVISKLPKRTYGFSAGTTVGSFGTRNGFVDVTGAIGEAAAGRLIANVERTDGYRGLNRDIVEISPSLTLNIAEDKVLNIDFDHRDMKIQADNYGILFDRNGKVASVSDKTRYYTPFNTTDQRINRLAITHNWTISDALSLRTAFTNDSRDLYLLRNAGGSPGNLLNSSTGRSAREQTDDARYTTFQNELIWKTNTGAIGHTVLAGVELNNTAADTFRTDYALPAIANIYSPVILETSLTGLAKTQSFDRKIKSDTVSVYLQDQLSFGEHWKLRASIRNDRVQFSDKGFSRTTLNGVTAYRYRVVDEAANLTTGSLGAVYQPTKDLAFYAGYSEGAFVNLATEATIVSKDPEASKQTEVGVKTTLFGGLADVNAALFNTRRENYFITLPNSNNQPTPDGMDRSRGLEIDFGIHPMTGWNVTGNFVTMDPENKSRNLVSGNTVLNVDERSAYGLRPSGVSRQLFSLWNSYEIQSGMASGLKFGIGARYKSDSYADTLNVYKVPSYTVFDAAVSYRRDKWEAALNLKNLTDKTYYTSATFSGALPGDPRSLYATLRFDFK